MTGIRLGNAERLFPCERRRQEDRSLAPLPYAGLKPIAGAAVAFATAPRK